MLTITIFTLLILIMSVVIHEVSHGYAAFVQGDTTAYYEGRLTLNPLRHLDYIGSIIVPVVLFLSSGGAFTFGWAKPVPFNPYNLRNQRWGELFVAAAGPLSNIFIAVIFGLIVRFGVGQLAPAFVALSIIVVLVNLGLAIFNLIPVPPLDGSKVLFGFLPQRFQYYRQSLERYSFFLIFILILIPQFSILLSVVVSAIFTGITGMPLSLR